MIKNAAFAGGCFWHIQEEFDKLEGVVKTTVGYSGGELKNPNYEQVLTGKIGYAESVEVEYDDKKINYRQLVDFFWKIHNPTTLNQQGFDVGSNYRSVIFYYDSEQKKIAEDSKKNEEKKLGKKLSLKL